MHVGLSPSLHCSALLFSSWTPCPRRLHCRPGHHPSSIHIPESSILPADQISPKLRLFPRMERNAGISQASPSTSCIRRSGLGKGFRGGQEPQGSLSWTTLAEKHTSQHGCLSLASLSPSLPEKMNTHQYIQEHLALGSGWRIRCVLRNPCLRWRRGWKALFDLVL